MICSLKHWQTFTIIFGPQLIFSICGSWRLVPPESFLRLMPITVAWSFLLILIWLGGIMHLYDELPSVRLRLFYVGAILAFGIHLSLIVLQILDVSLRRIEFRILRILPVLWLMYGSLITAKLMLLSERARSVQIGDYAGRALLLVLSPIGLWIVQPKVNAKFEIEEIRKR